MSARVAVTFLPSGATAWVAPGTTVLEASRVAGAPVNAQCGGRGTCGTCGVRVTQGRLADPGPDEQAGLARAPAGIRLACRARVSGAVTVRPIVVHRVDVSTGAAATGGELVAGVDLGTTTVAAIIIDAKTGREVARATVPNRQQSFGADVLSRVSAALAGHAAELREAAHESVREVLLAAAGDRMTRIGRVVVAGNSVMSALLTGADVTGLASAPFTAPVPVADEGLRASVGLGPTGAGVTVLPPVASFVGGDILAGLVALDALRSPQPLLFVDVGTNAEVAVVAEGRLTVTSAPAGPAFEGGGISCGGPAVTGAVVRVDVGAEDVKLETIGGAEPVWMSGAGLVSAVAALRESGHLDADGVLLEDGPLRDRVFVDEAGVRGLRLGDAGSEVTVNQLDVRAFQLAKAAVTVAVAKTLERAGVEAGSVARVVLAGAFGAALDPRDVVELGLLPWGLSVDPEFPGNTSLAGAAAIVLDGSLTGAWADTVRLADHVELASDASFTKSLMGALVLAPAD